MLGNVLGSTPSVLTDSEEQVLIPGKRSLKSQLFARGKKEVNSNPKFLSCVTTKPSKPRKARLLGGRHTTALCQESPVLVNAVSSQSLRADQLQLLTAQGFQRYRFKDYREKPEANSASQVCCKIQGQDFNILFLAGKAI